MKVIRPISYPIYNTHYANGIQLLTRLRLELSHLRDHKFKHNFLDTIHPLRAFSLEIKSAVHFFLNCRNYTTLRQTLVKEIITINTSFLNNSVEIMFKILLY